MQHGQIFELKTMGADGQRLWAYRYRIDGRGSRRIQRGGYASADDAKDALQRALTATQRRKGRVRVTLADLAEEYLAQHDGQPETTAKLRWLLTKSTAAFGSMPLTELHAREIAAWRMTLPTGHRFEATQASDRPSPAPSGGACSTPTRPRPASTTRQLRAARCARSTPMANSRRSPPSSDPSTDRWSCSPPPPGSAQANGSRSSTATRPRRPARPRPPSLPRQPRQAHQDQHRPRRAAPAIRARPLDQLPSPRNATSILFPAPESGYLDLHNWRPRHWRPAQRAAGITPTRRLFDLRHPRHRRAARRTRHLRALALPGHQPHQHRPHPRPPRPRQPPPRPPAPRRLQQRLRPRGRRWTFRRRRHPVHPLAPRRKRAC
jgi:hypothetical protein